MARKDCYAPVFEGQNWLVCLLLILMWPAVAFVFLILLIFAAALAIFLPGLLERIICNYKRYLFRIRNCRKGNSDPNIRL